MDVQKEREEYRKNNQMDYLLAIDFLHKYPKVPEIFETIYKITRVHVPDKVYKYFSLTDDDILNDKKLNTLLDNKVYMASPEELNDPFEANAYFIRTDSIKKDDTVMSDALEVFESVRKKIVISSFTSQGVNCMPMWAHYTNNHQGYCLAYDTREKNNFNLKSNLLRVQYLDSRFDVTNIVEDAAKDMQDAYDYYTSRGELEVKVDNIIMVHIIIFLACLKHDSWSYEHELRCITGQNAPWVPFMDAFPSEIYIGYKCSPENKKKLIGISDVLGIPIYEMEYENESISYEYKAHLIDF